MDDYRPVEEEPGRAGRQELPKGLAAVLTDNPFYVFGIPCTGTVSDAREVIRRIEPLQRLNKAGAYKPQIDLAGVERPDRGKQALSAALSELPGSDAVWLWFTDDTWCGYEKGKVYRNVNWLSADPLALRPEDAAASASGYDAFLASFMDLLRRDPQLKDTARWQQVLRTMRSLYEETASGMPVSLQERIPSDDTRPAEELAASLKRSVLRPVLAAIGDLDSAVAGALLSDPVWTDPGHPFSAMLCDAIAQRATGWVDDAVRPMEETNRVINKQNDEVTDEEADRILHVLADFEQKYWKRFQETDRALPQDSPYRQRIREKAGYIINYLRVKMYKRKTLESAHFYSICYPYIYERLIEKGDWKANEFDGYPLDMVDLEPEYFTDVQILTRANLFASHREYDRAEEMFHELSINRRMLFGVQSEYDYYLDLGERRKAQQTVQTANELLLEELAAGKMPRGHIAVGIGLYLQADLSKMECGLRFYRELAAACKRRGDSGPDESYRALMELLNAGGTVSYVDCAVQTGNSDDPCRKVQTYYLLQKGLEQGELSAYSNLGFCRRNAGYGCYPDYKKSVRYYRAGAQQGDIRSLAALGEIYYKGDLGVRQDQKKGLELLYEARDRGSVDAAKDLEAIQKENPDAYLFRLPKEQKVRRLHADRYYRYYIRRVDYDDASQTLMLRLWVLNLHNHPVLFRPLVLGEGSGKFSREGERTVPAGEMISYEVAAAGILRTPGRGEVTCRISSAVFDTEPFCGKRRVLSKSDMFMLRLDGRAQTIRFLTAEKDTSVRPVAPVVPGGSARRLRDRNALEISFETGKPPKDIVARLQSCGYQKARFRQTWTWVYTDEESYERAARLAGDIAGGYIAD